MQSDINYFTTVIVTALFANSMGFLELMALRALHKADLSKFGIARSTGISLSLRSFSFRYCHFSHLQ